MKSRHETGHSEFTETEEWTDSYPPQQDQSEDDKKIYIEINDLTNFPLEQATLEEGNNKNIELDKYDGAQKDNDQFKETPSTSSKNTSIKIDDLTNFTPEQATTEKDNNENTALDEGNVAQKDKDSDDQTPTTIDDYNSTSKFNNYICQH